MRPGTVTICDDATGFRLLVRAVLSDAGWTVVADDGRARDGLQSAQQAQPQVVLWDFLLPDQDDPAQGLGDLRRATPRSRIVLVSGLPPGELDRESERLGVDACFQKASPPGALVALLADLP